MLAGCDQKGGSGKQSAQTAEPAAPADHTYTVRGIVRLLPDPKSPGAQLNIQHEAIPEFVDWDGKKVGMKEMVMPFPVKPGVSLEGIAVGDKVEFVFEVFTKKKSYHLTKITKLPADTAINVGGGK